MSDFLGEDDDNFAYAGEGMEEVEVDEGAPADDESVADSDVDEGAEEVHEPVVDMSYACFRGHSDSVYCAAIHPSQPGVVLTGGGDDVAYLWRYKQSQEDSENPTPGEAYSPIQLTGHTDTVTSVGFNFNGSLALTGAYDGTVRIWQVETGALVQVLEGPEDVEWAQWHNKGNAIIAGSRDGTVWMWLTHNGQCVHVFAGHDGGVACGLFSQDGKSICTGGEDGTVRQWQPKTGACRHVFAGGAAMGGTGMGHEAEVTCLAGSADGDLVLSGSVDGTMRLYGLTAKRLLQTFVHSSTSSTAAAAGAMDTVREGAEDEDEDEGDEVSGVECVGFAPGAFKWVASGGADKALKVWDTVSGHLRCTCMHGGSVVALSWHETQPVICTAALDNLLRLWDARNGALLIGLTGHSDLVTSFNLVPLNPLNTPPGAGEGYTDAVVSVSDDNTARVFLLNVAELISV